MNMYKDWDTLLLQKQQALNVIFTYHAPFQYFRERIFVFERNIPFQYVYPFQLHHSQENYLKASTRNFCEQKPNLIEYFKTFRIRS